MRYAQLFGERQMCDAQLFGERLKFRDAQLFGERLR